MIQYGDIRALSGYTLEPVDLIVGGSPCQNLSIAGNRKGLEGSESGLFLEMIRIIREMREQTNGVCPRYALCIKSGCSQRMSEDIDTDWQNPNDPLDRCYVIQMNVE